MKLVSVSIVVKRRIVISIMVAFVLASAVPHIGSAQSDPLIGTWKLNLAKSRFSPGPQLKSGILTYQTAGQGHRLTVENIDAEGRQTKSVNLVLYDGKYYPTTGVVGIDATAYTRINSNTVMISRMNAEKVVQTAIRVVSEDGRSMIITTTGVNANGREIKNVTVHDKQ